jgi:hypothetical protein
MDMIQKYRSTILISIITTTIATMGMLGLSGCSPKIRIGGYQHVDMSRSRYQEEIRKKADELAASQKPRDKRTAAELYGSINELELMDKCITEYFKEEPSMGVYLLERGEKIHRFYKSSQ